MSEILCPHCRRRLRLSTDAPAEMMRCPSCDTTFPLNSARTAPSRTRSGQRPARNPCLMVALVIGVVLLVIGAGATAVVVIVWRGMQSSPSDSAVPKELDEAARQEQFWQSLRGRPPVTENEIAKQVQPLLDHVGIAFRSQVPSRIISLFDLDRMVDELVATSGGEVLQNTKERRDFRRTMSLSPFGMAWREEALRWDASEIRKVKKLNDDEAVVIARHKQSNGASLKMRWWVTRRNGGWMIYDFENVDAGLRVSSEIAALLDRGRGRAREIGSAIRSIVAALQAVSVEDLKGAEQKLAEVHGVPLPPRFDSLRQLANGMFLLQRGKFSDALKALEEADRLQPDVPITDFLRGVALNRLGKSDLALKHLSAYRDLFGDDTQVRREIDAARRVQGR